MLGRHLLYQSGPQIPVGEKWTFTSDGSWVAPANGDYKITLVGAGGKGGSGCEGNPTEKVEDCATFVVRAEAHQEVAAALGKLSYKRIR